MTFRIHLIHTMSWENLNGEIRATESRIQTKLQELSRFNSSMDGDGFDIECSAGSYSVIQDDIQHLLKRYQSILEDMEKIAYSSSNRSSRMIIERQKEVKRELQNDYKRILSSIQQKENRILLMRSNGMPASSEDDEMNSLLKERGSVRNALHMADEYLGRAADSHQSLVDQRRRLVNSQHHILGIVNRIPGVNTLMRSIQNKKSKDSLIVAGVVAVCVCFCIWYAFR